MERKGVFLARLQPLHNGHAYIINKIIEEKGHAHVVIGSADKSMSVRNPLPISIRQAIIKTWLIENNLTDKVTVYTLNDLTTEEDNSHDWGDYLYSSICEMIGDEEFDMYYSDSPKIMLSWFGEALQQRV